MLPKFGDNDVTVDGQILHFLKYWLHFWILRPQISLHTYFCVTTVYSLVDLNVDSIFEFLAHFPLTVRDLIRNNEKIYLICIFVYFKFYMKYIGNSGRAPWFWQKWRHHCHTKNVIFRERMNIFTCGFLLFLRFCKDYPSKQ